MMPVGASRDLALTFGVIDAGYSWAGLHNYFGGAEFAVGFGFLWGRGR